MQSKNISISLVIPILNEEKNINILTNKITKSLKKIKHEIIFVDDNSDDNSKEILKILKRKKKNFKPIFRINKKRDLTQSCFEGIVKSKYENILIMDGDLQHDPKYIPKMLDLKQSKSFDIVVGARKLINGPNQGLSETRRLASIILIKLFQIFNIKTSDPMSGFFLFNKKVYKNNKKRYFGKGFKILSDILINSEEKLRVKDIYINFKRRYESTSKMNYKILLILIHFYVVSLFKKLLF